MNKFSSNDEVIYAENESHEHINSIVLNYFFFFFLQNIIDYTRWQTYQSVLVNFTYFCKGYSSYMSNNEYIWSSPVVVWTEVLCVCLLLQSQSEARVLPDLGLD